MGKHFLVNCRPALPEDNIFCKVTFANCPVFLPNTKSGFKKLEIKIEITNILMFFSYISVHFNEWSHTRYQLENLFCIAWLDIAC